MVSEALSFAMLPFAMQFCYVIYWEFNSTCKCTIKQVFKPVLEHCNHSETLNHLSIPYTHLQTQTHTHQAKNPIYPNNRQHILCDTDNTWLPFSPMSVPFKQIWEMFTKLPCCSHKLRHFGVNQPTVHYSMWLISLWLMSYTKINGSDSMDNYCEFHFNQLLIHELTYYLFANPGMISSANMYNFVLLTYS